MREYTKALFNITKKNYISWWYCLWLRLTRKTYISVDLADDADKTIYMKYVFANGKTYILDFWVEDKP